MRVGVVYWRGEEGSAGCFVRWKSWWVVSERGVSIVEQIH
jgi:hypothetical protein